MSFKLSKISLEQWAAFRAVVEQGGYEPAAESLNKSQSSVSYAIKQLQEHLPAPVLAIRGRKAELTELGRLLYRRACSLLDQAAALDKAAVCLAEAGQSEISIAVETLAPIHRLFDALAHFSKQQPYVHIRVLETTLSGTDEALLEGRADLAITPHVPPGFLSEPLCAVAMLPVVYKQHSLAAQNDISEHELAAQRHLLIRDSGRRREQNVGWLGSEQRWTLSHFSSCLAAVKAGLGFAFLPQPLIEQELKRGELVQLNLAFSSVRYIQLYLVTANQSYASPAVRQLAAELKAVS
ncbi:LysR family transcriptional regulator [Agaribacterium sp. ZY112]|uniref:LysR family transcriptional regulator n=1 Tax=Agaribacterium sp. ZY112 TaxID=3233574 RepID=UPI003525198C